MIKDPLKIMKNKALYRADMELTSEVAGAILELVRNGRGLFAGGKREVVVKIKGEDVKIPTNTIHSWIKRNNYVKDTGELFRDLVDYERELYRTKQRELKQKMMLKESEELLHKTIRMKDTNIIMTKSGQTFERKDPKLTKIKTDVAMFLTERLDAQTYGQKTETKNTTLMLSLADLREAEEKKQNE